MKSIQTAFLDSIADMDDFIADAGTDNGEKSTVSDSTVEDTSVHLESLRRAWKAEAKSLESLVLVLHDLTHRFNSSIKKSDLIDGWIDIKRMTSNWPWVQVPCPRSRFGLTLRKRVRKLMSKATVHVTSACSLSGKSYGKGDWVFLEFEDVVAFVKPNSQELDVQSYEYIGCIPHQYVKVIDHPLRPRRISEQDGKATKSGNGDTDASLIAKATSVEQTSELGAIESTAEVARMMLEGGVITEKEVSCKSLT